MNDLQSIQARIAQIRARLDSDPDEAKRIDAEIDQHHAFIREAETAMFRRPAASEKRGGRKAPPKPIFGDES